MRSRVLIGLLVLIALLAASRPVVRSTANGLGSQPAAPRLQSTWTVENRCRMLYLPAILRGGTGAAAPAAFAPAQPAQGTSLDCIRVSDADLALIEWSAVAETYARQANRNRQAFDMAPLSTWGR
jgi:hypothetical protein